MSNEGVAVMGKAFNIFDLFRRPRVIKEEIKKIEIENAIATRTLDTLLELNGDHLVTIKRSPHDERKLDVSGSDI